MYKIMCQICWILLTLVGFSSQAMEPPFTLTTGYTNFPATNAGTPNSANDFVEVRQAPAGTGDVTRIRNLLFSATMPGRVINSRLTQGPFAAQIAQMPATITTAEALDNRPDVSNATGTVINSTAALNQNRAAMANNTAGTFIFRGNVNVDSPIMVGSNKTIWVDGVINYIGPDFPLTGGDEFSPVGTRRAGVFSVEGPAGFANRLFNVEFQGTKRGEINVNHHLAGIYTFNVQDVIINGIEFYDGFNTIFTRSTLDLFITNNVIANSLQRAMHLIAANTGAVTNNLMFDNDFDGLDVDAFTTNFDISLNVVVGARIRNLIWTEIDANNNIIANNVGIHLDRVRELVSGGFEENGTEEVRRGVAGFNGSSNNAWTDNNIFYALKSRDGLFMVNSRFIQFDTITYNNNYVWTESGAVTRHNPRPEPNQRADVRYLTLATPADSQFVENGTYTMESPAGQRLIVDSANNALMADSNQNDNQRWEFTHLGNDQYTIRNLGTNRFLEVPFAACANGANVGSWTSANSNHQRWEIRQNITGFTLLPLHCLTMALDRPFGAANANAQLFEARESGTNQRLSIIPLPTAAPPPPPPPPASNQIVADGIYFLDSPFNTQRLINNGSNNALMANPSSNDDQRWEFTHLGNNEYTIRNIGANRFLEVPFATCANLANVGTWTSAGQSHQRWSISANGSNFRLSPLHCTTRAIDRNGGAINANAHLFNFSPTNNNQKWDITGV